jgi:NTP pyrophosphatase (non-canonical NTP hydrolase)
MKLDLQKFREINVERAKEGFRCYDNQPITYWTTALAGEVGELCNMIKKMQRVAVGGIDGGSSYSAKDITPEKLREEIGGIAIYLDLLASLLGISLEEAIMETFDAKSRQLGFPQYLNTPTP